MSQLRKALKRGDSITYELICRCLFDIVLLEHGYEQDKMA
jgi:hypothetical protein